MNFRRAPVLIRLTMNGLSYMERYTKEMDEMRKRQQEVKEGVHLATMHSSKGLEYDKVFILDAAEGITPYKKAVLDADLEEERRMFYVAMTRAKKELTICWAKKQFSHELTCIEGLWRR